MCVSGVCSSFVIWENSTAVSVCSSILANLFCSEGAILSSEYRFEGFVFRLSRMWWKGIINFLSKTEIRVFVYFSLVGEPPIFLSKTFNLREAEEEGTDVEPLKNDINTAGSLFGQGEHLGLSNLVFSVKNGTFPSGIWVKICICNDMRFWLLQYQNQIISVVFWKGKMQARLSLVLVHWKL